MNCSLYFGALHRLSVALIRGTSRAELTRLPNEALALARASEVQPAASTATDQAPADLLEASQESSQPAERLRRPVG